MLTLKLLAIFILTAHGAELVFDKSDDGTEQTPIKVRYLDPHSTIHYTPLERRRGFFENDLRTYCYRGNPKTLARLFESIELQLDIEGDDYTQYEGATPREVREHYEEQRSLFSFSLFNQKRSRLPLSPFDQQCIGIVTLQPYRVHLQQTRIDFWRVVQLMVGVLTFIYAGRLSQNAIFYYIIGVAVGVCSSFMLLIWLCSKLLPRRTMMVGAVLGGWSIGLYVVHMLWQNIQTIILTYRIYVFWYILITGLISFFFCYRWGPPQNQRSRNIIKWSLQLLAIALIYLSSYNEEATIATALLTAITHYFPLSVWFKLRAFYLRRFPPKRKLLSNEEYYEQGVRETTKALEELRTYASSPDCKQWRVMSKLKDPLRFAAFVEGASHLRDEEILHFESSQVDDDEELDLTTEDEEENEVELPNTRYSHYKSPSYLTPNGKYQNQNNDRFLAETMEISDDEDQDQEGDLHHGDLPYVEVPRNRQAPIPTQLSNGGTRSRRSTSQQLTITSSTARRESPRLLPQRRTPTRSSYLVQAARQSSQRDLSNSRRGTYLNEDAESDEY